MTRGSDSFSWDYEDRMVEATVNSVTTTFAYRGDGLRDSRTVGMNTTTFTWDIASGLPVVLDDGNQYVYGAGLVSMKQSGNWYYYLADGLGSTMAIVDSSGNSQKSYQYDLYGEVTGGSGSLANDFDFAGQQTDATGLQYLRARYYDPATGTFLSRDPLADAPVWIANPTGYASNSPISFKDPSGLEPCYDDHGVEQPEVMCVKLNPRAPDPERGVDISCTFGCKVAGAVEKVKGWVDEVKGLLGEYAGFRNAKLRDQDVRKHAKEWGGDAGKEDYLQRVSEFFGPERSGHLKLVRDNGETVYYNVARNEYGVVSVDGYVKTLFRPREGANYFWRELVNY